MRLFSIFFRFITVLYYLNDVDEGGETAFPVADSDTYVHNVSFQASVVEEREP